MTNYEKMKNMSVEEIARFLFFVKEENCGQICKKERCGYFGIYCKEGIRQWINSEVKEDDKLHD